MRELVDAEADRLLAEAVRETSAALRPATVRPDDTGVDPAVLRQYRRIHRRYLTDTEIVPAPTTPPLDQWQDRTGALLAAAQLGE